MRSVHATVPESPVAPAPARYVRAALRQDVTLAVVLAFGAVLWLQTWFAGTAGHEHGGAWWQHWVRDGGLALPAVLGAIIVGRSLIHRWVAERAFRPAVEVAGPAVAASLALALASPLHPVLAGHAVPSAAAAASHGVEVLVLVLPACLLLSLLVAALRSRMGRRAAGGDPGRSQLPLRVRQPVLVGTVLAAVAAALLQALHVQHLHGLHPAMGWFRATVLMAPIAILAVWFSSVRAARWAGRLDGGGEGHRGATRVVWSLLTAAGLAVASIPASLSLAGPGGLQGSVLSLVDHVGRDASVVLLVTFTALMAVGLALGIAGTPFARVSAPSVSGTAGRRPVSPVRAVFSSVTVVALALSAFVPVAASGAEPAAAAPEFVCGKSLLGTRTIKADVVALDQPFHYNRLGATNPAGMIYALRRDVVAKPGKAFGPGNVMLRPDLRPRPLVLRANVGDCLEINFQNLLSPTRAHEDQPADRHVGMQVKGMTLVNAESQGSWVGKNESSLVAPGGKTTYRLFAEHENTYLIENLGVATGAQAAGGTSGFGLFGAVNVEPFGSQWFRSQVSRAEMDAARKSDEDIGGYPVLDYPKLAILQGNEIVHSDLNAIIAGPAADGYRIPRRAYPESYWENHIYNNATKKGQQPFREFTIIFHDEIKSVQAFEDWFENPAFEHTLHSVRDSFAINYGTDGAGAEVIANRLGVGPMWDCVDCKYEEFFLTSWAVGDPATVVDVPANTRDGNGKLIPGPKAEKVTYPGDPGNVHHSYLNDRVKIRNLSVGKEHHIFHQHAHQWQFTPNSEKSTYLDSQLVGPGSGYSYEIAYGGSGNRNKTPGDSIFHCHFYPHFAQGMWGLWRVHDTFERGTPLKDGKPVPKSRALPDGEIAAGVPMVGVVPLPSLPMAPLPNAATTVVAYDLDGDGRMDSSQLDVDGDGIADLVPDAAGVAFAAEPKTNPGFPFFVPGVAGHRPPTAPLDLHKDKEGRTHDGGLQRHIIVGGEAVSYETRLDFNKILERAEVVYLPEEGTPAEKKAMAFHADPPKVTPRADVVGSGPFETNGLPAKPGAAFADPCRSDSFWGKAIVPKGKARTYSGAVFQTRAVLNKAGWHYPQQRLQTLWADVGPTLAGSRPLEPLAMRMNVDDCTEFLHTNLVPSVYELDDYQVRTPTDVIGQHIHLVKFDVLSADGAANGFNYEDGTFSPQEVEERVHAIRTQTDLARAAEAAERAAGVPPDEPIAPTGATGDVDAGETADTSLVVVEPDASIEQVATDVGGEADIAETCDVENGGGAHNDRLDNGETPSLDCPLLVQHPYFKDVAGVGDLAWGARTTVQRWYVDALLNNAWDQGVGSVFTHDHFGPSTHQQVGLYSAVLVEPEGSLWHDPETGARFGARWDGGPTSWRADISFLDPEMNRRYAHREFYLAIADFVHAYQAGGGRLRTQDNGAGVQIPSYADHRNAINPSFRQTPPADRLADLIFFPNRCPDGSPRPCPEAVSADDPGTFTVNYRNEPVGLRVFDPRSGGRQANGAAGDLARAFESRTDRAIAALNRQPAGQARPGVAPGDPYTPLLRVYAGDRVRIRTQIGAHEEQHQFSLDGLAWLQEPLMGNSGWRASQAGGISEFATVEMPVLPDLGPGSPAEIDYRYTLNGSTDGEWNGVWGLVRSYQSQRSDLRRLPNNQIPATSGNRRGWTITNQADFDQTCPRDAPVRRYNVTAVRAADVLGPRGLVYNSRTTEVRLDGAVQGAGPLHDPTALMYVPDTQLVRDARGRITGMSGTPQPLVLRANAGDCVKVQLTNALPTTVPDLPGYSVLPPIVHKNENVQGGGVVTFNANDIRPSSLVGLQAQALQMDVRRNGGRLVGGTGELVAPGQNKLYTWYAGRLHAEQVNDTSVRIVSRPVEFGATNLLAADPIEQQQKGLVGALIIQPPDATWPTNETHATSTTVTFPVDRAVSSETASFREHVVVLQSDANLRYGGSCRPTAANLQCAVRNIASEGPGTPEDSEDSGQRAINYRTEPLWFRLGLAPDTPFGTIGNSKDVHKVYSNTIANGNDPQTPVFTAAPGETVRMRVVQPGGHMRGHVFTLNGHAWQREPYVSGPNWATAQRCDPAEKDASLSCAGDRLAWTHHEDPTILDGVEHGEEVGHQMVSRWTGSQEGFGANNHFDIVVPHAGGPFETPGDYLFRDNAAFGNLQGMWGILRVQKPGTP
jgi:manganese oxidase